MSKNMNKRATEMNIAEVDEQKTKYLQHFINKHDTIVSN
jgi:hypothetical protein